MATLLDDRRRVHRLRVRASDQDDVREVAVLLEDALRTATLPHAGRGGLLLIRTLALGVVPRNAGPRTVALQIERAMRELESGAVRYDSPAAPDAAAVLVGDPLEALVARARLHAKGVRPAAWFWSRLVPDWSADAGHGDGWVHLIEAAQALPAKAHASGAIVSEAVAAGKVETLLGAVSDHRARRWLLEAGFDDGDASEAGPAPIAMSSRIRLLVPTFRQVDARTVWLLTALAVFEQPSRAGHSRLPALVRRWLRHALEEASGAVRFAQTAAAAEPPRVPRADISAPAEASVRVEPPNEVQPSTDELRPATPAVSPEPQHPDAAPGTATRPFETDAALTTCAGLLFLIPVLERLGVRAWLQANPSFVDTALPVRLLRAVGKRTGLDVRDPLWQVLDGWYGEEEHPDPIAPPLSAWPEAVRVLLERPAVSVDAGTPAIDLWTLALRRWCRRHARVGLVSLVRRPGRLRMSRTGVDVTFAMSQIDVRIRRQALDIDPGWVPWLGQVVRFHYERNDDVR